jgi:hypothetical protein
LEEGYLCISVVGKNLPNWGVKWGMSLTHGGRRFDRVGLKWLSLRAAKSIKFDYTFRVGVGMRIAFMYSVFHRILDLKTGWISIRAFFFAPT